MARKAPHSGVHSLTRTEAILGWCYLPVYLIVLNLLLQLINEKLSLGMTALTINIVYFAVNLLAVVLIFRQFLRQSFFGGSFWGFVQALVLGFAMYYAGTWVLQFLLSKLAPGFTIYNNNTVAGLISANTYVMMAITVLVAPIIEGNACARSGIRLHPAHLPHDGVSCLRHFIHADAQLAVLHALSRRQRPYQLYSVYSCLHCTGLDL